MALQFIFGRAGAGKTRYLYEEVIGRSLKQPEGSYLVVVPEQFTMQAQRELIRLHPNHGMMNIDVLSFKRLAYRVFDEQNVRLPVVLDDMGKSMVLRRVSGGSRKELGLYGSHLGQAGFIGQLKSQISELYQYGVGAEELRELSGQAPGALLAQKLKDLSVIYQEFAAYIKDHYITAEEILDILSREIGKSALIQNSQVFLDGFTGFTPVQYRVLEQLLSRAREVVCAVTADEQAKPYEEGGIQNLFYMSKHTVCRLTAMAKERGVEKKEDLVLSGKPGKRFAGSPALDFLERGLYRYRRETWQGEQDSLELFAGQTPAEEIRFVAASIEELVRERGLRYRDMAVVTGDLASYGREAALQFEQAGIPFFMDSKKSILENPMVELIRAVLEALRDFSYENVFRYLKTGLVYDLEERENGTFYGEEEAGIMASRLENYVRALGISGWKRWDMPWERQYRGAEDINLEELNRFKDWVLAPLRPLREAFSQAEADVGTMTAALKSYLEEMGLEEKLSRYEAWFRERGRRGDENLAREYGQAYGLVMELLERLTGLLGEERTDRRTYGQILDAGFGEIQVGTIPATIDQVMVGDLKRSRLDGVKVLFFVGLNDGVVPQKKNGGSLLTDRDREFFKSRQIQLAPTAKEEGCMQKFYLYLTLTKPSEKLVMTWALRSGDGKSLRPSQLLGEVKKLFPELRERTGEALSPSLRTAKDRRERLLGGLRDYRESREEGSFKEGEEDFLELCRFLLKDRESRAALSGLIEAAFYSYEERGIGRAAASALYGRVLQGSVTRLEQYASCAYAHFLRYGLELMERQEYELAAVDMGNLFHQSIDRCFRVMKEEGRDWRSLGDEERKALVRECVGQVTAEYGNTIMSSTARNRYLAGRVERMTDRTIWALAEQVKRGDFVPSGFEVGFSAIDNLKAMRIPLSEDEEMQLKGRIDRLDLCRDGDTLYVKIIDYKSGSTHFDLAAVYYGLQLQLVVYLDAATELLERREKGTQVVPAGLFYYNIQDPLVEKQGEMGPEEVQREILKQLRMNGLVNRRLEVIRHLDRDIETQSDVIPVALKAGIIQESRSSVTDERGFERLKAYVGARLQAAGREILRGEKALTPVKEGQRTACDYCPYHAVCGFDTKTAGYGYRRLRAIKPQEIWEELAGKDKEGKDGSTVDQPAEAGN